jgi:hypothetical protein
MPFRGPGTEAPRRADFEASTLQPIPTLESVGSSPLRFGPSYTVSPTSHRTNRQHRDARRSMLRPRFFPLQRLASREEPLSSGGIPAHRLRCVPRVSHPLDALLPPRPAELVSSRFRSWGSPSRLAPHTVPYALSSAGPLRFSTGSSRTAPPLQGSSTPCRSCPRAWGLARWPRRCLHGIGPFEASCVGRREPNDQLTSPHALLRVGRVLAFPLAPQGLYQASAQPLSLESDVASMGFSTSSSISTLRSDAGTGLSFPRRPVPRCRRSGVPLRPSSRPCRSSPRQPFR